MVSAAGGRSAEKAVQILLHSADAGDAVDGLLNGIAVVAVGVDRDDASHNILLFRRGPPSAAPEAVDKPSRRRSRREK